jgi:hypothetical protein
VTKLDLVLERIRRLPPERQEALAVEMDVLLGHEENGGLSDEEWAAVEPTLDTDAEEIPHEQIVAEFRAKFPG